MEVIPLVIVVYARGHYSNACLSNSTNFTSVRKKLHALVTAALLAWLIDLGFVLRPLLSIALALHRAVCLMKLHFSTALCDTGGVTALCHAQELVLPL